MPGRVRQFGAVDLMGGPHDARGGRLAEHLGEADHRDGARVDEIGENLSRPDRGQLIDVADEDHRRRAGRGLEQLVGQGHVDHRALVGHQQVAVERGEFVALELAVGRIDLQEAMDGLGLEAGGLRQALGGASGRARRAAP